MLGSSTVWRSRRVPIAALDAPELAPYRGLLRPGDLRQRGWFVAEGRWVVERLLATEPGALLSLLLSPGAERALAPHLSRLPAEAVVYAAPSEAFKPLTGVHFHQGCLAVAKRPRPRSAAQLLAESQRPLLLEGVADPDNVGSLFRSAQAFGVDAVLLGPRCADPLYRKALRASMGAALSVAHAWESDAEAWRMRLEQAASPPGALFALSPAPMGIPLETLGPRPGRVAVLLGAEGPGLSREALQRASRIVRVSMATQLDSLNVGVAGAIALHWLYCGPAARA